MKGATQWGAPALILFLLPKCPMCVAAYVVMFTGIGLSFETAAWLRMSVVWLCTALLVWLAFGALRRRWLASQALH